MSEHSDPVEDVFRPFLIPGERLLWTGRYGPVSLVKAGFGALWSLLFCVPLGAAFLLRDLLRPHMWFTPVCTALFGALALTLCLSVFFLRSVHYYGITDRRAVRILSRYPSRLTSYGVTALAETFVRRVRPDGSGDLILSGMKIWNEGKIQNILPQDFFLDIPEVEKVEALIRTVSGRPQSPEIREWVSNQPFYLERHPDLFSFARYILDAVFLLLAGLFFLGAGIHEYFKPEPDYPSLKWWLLAMAIVILSACGAGAYRRWNLIKGGFGGRERPTGFRSL